MIKTLSEIQQEYIASESISEAVYHTLKDGIAEGIIAPGSRMVELELAESLVVSRTPVRDAIKRLLSDELLVYSASGNICVKKFTTGDVRNLIFALDDIRITATMHAADVITRFQLAEVKDILDTLDVIIEDKNGIYKEDYARKAADVNKYDELFHDVICESTDNPYILNHYHKLNTIFSIVKNMKEYKQLTSRSFSRESQEERVMIYQALKERDAQKALEWSIKHAQWIYRWKLSPIQEEK